MRKFFFSWQKSFFFFGFCDHLCRIESQERERERERGSEDASESRYHQGKHCTVVAVVVAVVVVVVVVVVVQVISSGKHGGLIVNLSQFLLATL